MKRELAAGLLLLALIGGAIYNIFYVGKLTRDISGDLYASQEALTAGNGERAEEYAERALQKWLGAEQYTHIFVRHSEIDATADAFYDGIDKAYSKLLYHLSSIATMEQISLGSIM